MPTGAELWNLCVAALGGLAVGIERQWSGHAVGPRAHFAGVRTFTLLGIVAGLSGWLWQSGLQGPATILLAGAGALVIVAYISASRRDIDGTTEMAAFVVLAAGLLAGTGATRVASGIIALTTLLLVEKKQLHKWVSKLDRDEVRAAARFAVMAAVILPLLPVGPFGPYDTIRPRMLWALVIFFSGLSFVGYVARRVIGPSRGNVMAGTLGGIVSSTSVTLTFARLSRTAGAAGLSLAAGTMGANAVLFPRVLIASAVIAPTLTRALWPAFVVPALIAATLAVRGFFLPTDADRVPRDRNPLHFVAALQMAALFQVVLFVVAFLHARFGQSGLYWSAAVLGLVDMDALTISMAQLTTAGTDPDATAHAVAIGVVANTAVKMSMALVIGRGTFRWHVAAGLAVIGLALGAWVVWY